MIYFSISIAALILCISCPCLVRSIVECPLNPTSVRFLWDPQTLASAEYSRWFSVETINNAVPSRRGSRHPRNKMRQVFDIDSQFAENMDLQYNGSSFRLKSEDLRLTRQPFNSSEFNISSFLDRYFDLDIGDGVRLATFKSVLVNNYGVVVDPNNCSRQVMTGGCLTSHGRVFKFDRPPVVHDLVIALGNGAHGTWHFPMELLLGLRNVPKPLLSRAIIHVPVRSAYISEWLHLIPGVNHTNVKNTPVIFAKTLLVPEMGFCAFPSPTQVDWLAHTVHPAPEITTEKQLIAAKTKSILLVQRSISSRKVSNKRTVRGMVESFAQQHGYHFILHDDVHLPSIREQIRLFSSSDIVVMPHGAAGLFTTFSPERACLIEFLPPSGWNLCYARLAYIRNLNYFGRMQATAGVIDEQQLQEGLDKCLAAVIKPDAVVEESGKGGGRSDLPWSFEPFAAVGVVVLVCAFLITRRR